MFFYEIDLFKGFEMQTCSPVVTFFQPPLAVVGNTVFALLVRLKICKRPIRRYDVGVGGPAISISLPGVDTTGPDTERRRQIALKALSDRVLFPHLLFHKNLILQPKFDKLLTLSLVEQDRRVNIGSNRRCSWCCRLANP
jgi:hypothetical protein